MGYEQVLENILNGILIGIFSVGLGFYVFVITSFFIQFTPKREWIVAIVGASIFPLILIFLQFLGDEYYIYYDPYEGFGPVLDLLEFKNYLLQVGVFVPYFIVNAGLNKSLMYKLQSGPYFFLKIFLLSIIFTAMLLCLFLALTLNISG